jgi:uncharacterized membrane protein
MKRFYVSARAKLGMALVGSSLASMGLYVASMLDGQAGSFAYLPWNLFLAWVALCAALWLERVLQRSLWSSWYALLVTALWLVFLPNTFYMISDFVHIQEAGDIDLLFDVVLFTSFILNGVILGFLSLAIVHWQLLKRLATHTAGLFIGSALFLCSFAIYIGRELRWNTWDIITSPSSLLFDVSDRVLKPHEHPHFVTTTLSFFVLLSSIYMVMWYVYRAGRAQTGREN